MIPHCVTPIVPKREGQLTAAPVASHMREGSGHLPSAGRKAMVKFLHSRSHDHAFGACLVFGKADTRIPARHVSERHRAMRNGTLTSPLDVVDTYKQQAKRLREALSAQGNKITHGEALEMVARQNGFRDWNTLSAAASKLPARRNAPPDLSVGMIVSGRYLNQPFVGEILSVTALSDGEHFRLSIHFAEPVDVVTFDSFSAFRQRINATVNRHGASPQRTSNGLPHLVLDL